MDNYNAKLIIKRYNFYHLFFTFIAAVLALLVLFLSNNILFFFITVLLFFLFQRIIQTHFHEKYIVSSLLNELNPEKYTAFLNAGKIVSMHLFERVNSAYYLGDYATVINICWLKLKNEKSLNNKVLYLLFLARSYFILGDLENVRLVCDKFKELTAMEIDCDKIRNNHIYFRFLELYLDEKFSECKALYEGALLKDETYKVLLYEIQTKFTYAISCYKCGDIEIAKENFNYIVSKAPYLNISVISQKYLNAIESNISYQPEKIVITTNESFILPKPPKSIKIYKIITLALIGLLTIGYCLKLILPSAPVHFKGLEPYTTRSDIRNLYGEPDEIKEYEYPAGHFYDSYEMSFLGIKGELKFFYEKNSDHLSQASFTIDSKDFETYEEYEKAVNTTCKYFDRVLFAYQKQDNSIDDDIDISWFRTHDKHSFSIFNTQIFDTELSNSISDGTVFQFHAHFSR